MKLQSNGSIYFVPKKIVESKTLTSLQKIILIRMWNDSANVLTMADLQLTMNEPLEDMQSAIYSMKDKGILTESDGVYSLSAEILTKLNWKPTIKSQEKKQKNMDLIDGFIDLVKKHSPGKTISKPLIEKKFNKLVGIELSLPILERVIINSIKDEDVDNKHKTPEYWLRDVTIAKYSSKEESNLITTKKPLTWKT